jgi:hypothetical protein
MLVLARAIPVLMMTTPALFRRNRQRTSRDDAFRDLFTLIQALFERASHLKPAWHAEWQERDDSELPEKYSFGSVTATEAAVDLRYATRLLHRNRWKSVVQPLFDEVNEQAWIAFQETADRLSYALVDASDTHYDRLLGDERDWITAAVEQFDDATRRRRQNQQSNVSLATQVAEGVYLPLYIAIQLSDRLIERMRYEAEQAK